jgi:hypothetical protein
LPQVVAAVLAAQLFTAAGAVAGPWAVTADPVVPGPPVVIAARVVPLDTSTVRLSSSLWKGAVPLASLAVDGRGGLTVPARADQLGFWAAGARPGQAGAAVVVGHVDLDGRAGVFAGLAAARPGTFIEASSATQTTRYRVVTVARYAKTRFPTDQVYGPTDRRELRLVTCGGRFDRRTGHYDENVVVTAVEA